MLPLPRDRRQRPVHRAHRAVRGRGAPQRRDERARRLQHEPAQAFGNAALGGVGERLLPREDGRTRDCPVDALGGGAPGQRAAGAVRRLGPHDRLAVAAGDDVQPVADGRGAVVAGPQGAPLDAVACQGQVLEPLAEVLTGGGLVGAAGLVEGAPCEELGHVLDQDHPRLDGARPVHDHPGEAPDLLRAGHVALCPGEVGAVGRGPQQVRPAAAAGRPRVDVEHVFAQVDGVRVVERVHPDGVLVVVDRHVGAAAEGAADALRRAAAAGEEVDDEGGHGGSAARGGALRSMSSSTHPISASRRRAVSRLPPRHA